MKISIKNFLNRDVEAADIESFAIALNKPVLDTQRAVIFAKRMNTYTRHVINSERLLKLALDFAVKSQEEQEKFFGAIDEIKGDIPDFEVILIDNASYSQGIVMDLRGNISLGKLLEIVSQSRISELIFDSAMSALKNYFGPAIEFVYKDSPVFFNTLFYGDLREFSLNVENRDMVKTIIALSADPQIGPQRFLIKDDKGNYSLIKKIKLFRSLGLNRYVSYVVRFPEGTKVLLESPKFIKLLKEGAEALKEFGTAIQEDTPTILDILSDVFTILQVMSAEERDIAVKLFNEDFIYTLSAADIPGYLENYVVYPEATELAMNYGQLNRYCIEAVNRALSINRERTVLGLKEGVYGQQLLNLVHNQVSLEAIIKDREERDKINKGIRQEVISEMRQNPQFIDGELLEILRRAREQGLIISLLSGSSRNPLARYFLKGKKPSKTTAINDVDVRLKEVLISGSDLNRNSIYDAEVISMIKTRMGEQKIWAPAFETSIEGKIKRFDKVGLDELYLRRYFSVLNSPLGRELLRNEFSPLYASNEQTAVLNEDKIRQIYNDKLGNEYRILENIVLLLKEITSERLTKSGIAVDIRGDYSAVTRGDVNINAIEIFYNKEEQLDIFDPELGLIDLQQGKVHLSKGSQCIYGKYKPINTILRAVSEIALGDILRFFRPSIQFGFRLDDEEVKVVKTGLDLLVHKGRSKFLLDKIQCNANKLFDFFVEEGVSSDQVRVLIENLGGIYRIYPEIFNKITAYFGKDIMQEAGENICYQYLSDHQRMSFLKGEKIYFEKIAIHETGGVNEKEFFEETPIEKIIKDKGLRPGPGQGYTKGNAAVYFGTDSRCGSGRAKGIIFIYERRVLEDLISGRTKLKDNSQALSTYGAYFEGDEQAQKGSRYYIMSLPEGAKDVLPLKFAEVVYLTPELYVKAETAWRRVVNSKLLKDVVNNPAVEAGQKLTKTAELKQQLNEDYFGRDNNGQIRAFEDMFKNIFSQEFNKPNEKNVLALLGRAVALNNEKEEAFLTAVAKEVYKKTDEEIAVVKNSNSSSIQRVRRMKLTAKNENVVSSGVKEQEIKERVLDIQKNRNISALSSEKGGIDFTAMPTVIQSMINPRNNFSAVSSSLKSIPLHNDDSVEWQQIEKMVNAGIIPSSERIKEYLVSSCIKGEFNQEMDKVICCISNIFRLEEERLNPADSGMCEILRLIESDKPADELQLELSKVVILP